MQVEAELGEVGGKEDSLESSGDHMTNPADAERFARETEVDSLAVGIGTAHGVYKSAPHLDIDRLAAIHAVVSAPLVLHGGSGISDEDFKKAIDNGIAKINIHTDLCLAGMKAMRESCAAIDPAKPATGDYLKTHTARVRAMKETVIHKMELFGSVGRAK